MTWLACLMVVVPAASPTTTTRSSSASAPAGAPRASTPLAAARQLAMTGRYDEAVAAYERIARQDPARRVPAAVGVADVMRLTGRYDEGLQRLTDVQPAGQKDAGWHLARARLLAARGQVDQAVEACRAAMGLEPDRYEARFRLAWLYEQTGELDRAARLYGFFDRLAHRRVPDRADQLVWHGRGFYRYSVLVRHPNLPKRTRYVLHELFQPAYETKDPQYWPARIAAAEQLYSKYNLVDAAEDYEAALAVNPKLPVAHAGLARIALEKWQFEACEKHLQGALDVNPKHVPSLNVRARLRLAERKCRQAAAEIDRALAVNPNDLEALSLAAAAHARLGERKVAERFEKRVAAINPRCALLPYTVAEWLAAARQFPQAEERYLQAARLDATWADPQTDLGLMYMQWGHEDKARKTLEAAWKLDRFNRKTFNVLKLLKQIEGFKRAESDHFIVKLDADEDAVLIPYFLDTLEAILPGLCRDYGHMPTAKTIVEVFPSHRAFSVRITSRPWIHTIGACTGRVIAMDAPRVGASMTGSFDWVRVLRHELTHTVTLAATHNRIPH